MSDRLKNHHEVMREDLRRQHYQELTRSVMTLLAEKQKALTQAAVVKSNVDALQQQVEQLSTTAEDLEMSMQSLSPTTGIIAKNLSGFMSYVIDHVNMIIARVWGYEMLVSYDQSQMLEESSLDFMFPVHIGEHVSEDISKVSRGQREMIDLAFLITALRFTGGSQYPLLLDEIGSGFATEHRNRLYWLLRELSGDSEFEQIFIVSHDPQMSQGLDAEYIALSEDGINLPEVYNQSVVIERRAAPTH